MERGVDKGKLVKYQTTEVTLADEPTHTNV